MSHSLEDLRLQGSRLLVGNSHWVRETQSLIRAIAPYTSSVLISGPSGSGKELIARAIHNESPQADKPFIAVNCAAISGPLFESHMFGHVQGAFTGANHSTLGCFRAADGGTIFLDEIGELGLEFQAKLLRVLQERTVTPVGSYEEHPVNLRVIVATNRNLTQAVAAETFREDLYYRLAVISLHTLPLAKRREDIVLLADYLLSTQCVKYGLPFKPLSPRALLKLEEYSWPGNVRELQNVLERAALLSRSEVIRKDDIVFENIDQPTHSLSAISHNAVSAEPTAISDDEHWPTLEDLERRHIQQTLEHTQFNQAAAARLLDVDRSVLRRRIRKLGVDISLSRPGRPVRIP